MTLAAGSSYCQNSNSFTCLLVQAYEQNIHTLLIIAAGFVQRPLSMVSASVMGNAVANIALVRFKMHLAQSKKLVSNVTGLLFHSMDVASFYIMI
jgi:hypothetical protein